MSVNRAEKMNLKSEQEQKAMLVLTRQINKSKFNERIIVYAP